MSCLKMTKNWGQNMSDQWLINKIIMHPVDFKYRIWTLFVSGYVHLAGCCKHDNESPGYINDGKILNYLSNS